MVFNCLQSLTIQSQITNDESPLVDEFDDNANESNMELDQDEAEVVDGDIDSSDELDPDQSNDDDSLGLDLSDANLYQWTKELKSVEVNFFTELVGPTQQKI
ncbi:hypothetical protein PoB_001990900 [Plakobranchus ocellatus]|uniref:Uncharacterized protein n=1 Tax=Plakobranchus ocellatus TaxID=259542 RepID=A0AAV3ZDE5_9GAST|nr:hypothetical protein PoB_001990900 [Plakobranchus ocellatus]